MSEDSYYSYSKSSSFNFIFLTQVISGNRIINSARSKADMNSHIKKQKRTIISYNNIDEFFKKINVINTTNPYLKKKNANNKVFLNEMKNLSLPDKKVIKERKTESLHEKTKKIITDDQNEELLVRKLKESQIREKNILKVYIFRHFSF